MTEHHNTETYRFLTEDTRLLDLVINSLYSDKDIFLRELISNASDAISKVKFLAISDEKIAQQESDYKITIKIDPSNKRLIISDSGIGMSKQELIDHLGTIARSGTHEFLKNMDSNQAQDMIGQFGVGFYSVFMVAQSVDVISRSALGEDAWMFSSQGQGSFTITPVNKNERGTTIIAHMKDDEYLHFYRVKHIIEKYSKFAPVPIFIEHEEKNDKDEKEWVTIRANETQPLWLKNKSNISDEEYKEFYKETSKDYHEPMTWIHGKIEGTSDYRFLLYIPTELPFYFWHQEKPKGVKLFVKNIFITDDASLLMPRYLSFISGIVDFQDLPLNVSRELLQEHKSIERAKTALTKKVLAHLQQLAQEQTSEYQKFWTQFGQMIKMFPAEDIQHKDTILPILRFTSTTTGQDSITGLDDYISRMKEDQKAIYYITSSTWDAAINSPHMDYFKKNNIEVLLLLDRVDESLMNYLGSYKDKDFQSITRAQLKDLSEEAAKEKETQQAEYQDLCTALKNSLSGKVKDVKISSRLVDAPCCLVVDDSLTLHMQRLLKEAGQQLPESLPILEINIDHKIIKEIQEMDSSKVDRWGLFLYSLAMLAEGGQLSDPASFSKQISQLLNQVHLTEI